MDRKFKLLLAPILVLSFVFSSCVRETRTRYEATLYNNTSQHILILPYKNGSVLSDDTIHIGSNSSFLYAQGSNWGNNAGLGFDSKYAVGVDDSVVIFFGSNGTVSHYINTPANYADKYYDYSSKRNISNIESYELTREKERKGVYIYRYNYYFTEADYEFAKD